MKFLAIDYGLSKIGLAISEGYFSHPYKVIAHDKWPNLLPRLIEEEKIGKIIIGISEGSSKKEAIKFAQELKKFTTLPIILWDETLTTQSAVAKMAQSGKSKKYRRQMQDAAAAAEILQSYLDNL